MYLAHQDFQLVVVELPQAKVDIDAIQTLSEMWLYLFERHDMLDTKKVTRKMSDVEEIGLATDALKKINDTPEESLDAFIFRLVSGLTVYAAPTRGRRLGVDR